MESSFATSTTNTSNDQRLLLGNIVDQGGGCCGSTTSANSCNMKNNQRRSPMRAWNQLSRLQRNLLYLLFIILAFACFWNITRLKIRSHPKNSNSSKDESSLLSNVDRLINNRMKEIDDERVIQPGIKTSGDNKNNVDEIANDKNPRNRIQAVHNIVKNGDGVNEFDANYNVDQNEDQAKENDDEDFENQDDKEKDDDGDKENEEVQNGQDSNQADENFRESYEQQEGNQLNEDDEDSFSLPPKDGSLKFKGPQNERQTKRKEDPFQPNRMESTALVSGEYSSGDENEDGRAKDVNYDDVGMDMGSTSGSESENECNTESKELHHSVRDGLFTSKEEYEAYQNQFRNVSSDKKDTSSSPKQEGADSEYGTIARNNANINKQPPGDSIEKDEYGGYQPTTSKKACRESPHKQSSPTREPRRRTDLQNKNENYKSNINDTASQKQPNNRQSLSEERLQDKLLLLSQEEPSSSGGDYGGSSKHYSRRSRSRSKDRNRRSSSPKSHSRRRSRSRSRSRERKKDHDRHRSSHHRSSKHHHHRDHRDRHRDKYDGRDRNYRGNDGRRNRERISEDHRQELRNKKLVNLGITSDDVLAAAAQSGSFGGGNSDAVAMRAQQMISKQLEAQVAKAKELTGVELPSYYNPSVINPLKYADQIKKRKLLWGSSGGGTGVKQSDATQEAPNAVEHNSHTKSSHEDTMQARKSIFAATAKKPEPAQKQSFNKWETTNFGDDKANDKFRRLMGIKASTVPTSSDDKNPSAVTAVGDKTAKFFHEQEVQYERARAFTHTQRGTGFGFSECVQQQSEPSQPTSSPKNNVDTSSTHPQRSIGEKLGFVKKSL